MRNGSSRWVGRFGSLSLIVALVCCVVVPVSGLGRSQEFTITIIHDGVYDGIRLVGVGFSALVESRDATVLFDTTYDPDVLLGNMSDLGIDPLAIDALVLSHDHRDHSNGMLDFLRLGGKPDVFFNESTDDYTFGALAEYGTIHRVAPGMEVAPGIFTTGEMTQGVVPEQSLAIPTGDGLVIVTGCGHPGVVNIATQARRLFPDEPGIALIAGGFHLVNATESELAQIVSDLRDLGVRQIMPCHCTGPNAVEYFQQEFGESCLEGGTGAIVAF